MKNFLAKIIFLSMILVVSTQAITFAKETPDELRAKLDKMSVEVLDKMYAKFPDAKKAVNNSYAYCTISSSSVNWGFLGSDRGRGLAYNKSLNKKFM
ncbi:MAG: hypothetical protein IJQ16_08245 [Selenomonadaceae bacterium]|nr:hypothetical protein [Selenomonadaceae bacterium]